MKIFMIHDYYQFRGGEDYSFEAEVNLLQSHGETVLQYTQNNRDIKTMPLASLAQKVIWNHEAYRAVREMIQREKPDLLHCQNIFPLVSPSVYYAAKAEGVPVVQSLRNYRLVCPGATCCRSGKICEDCLGKKVCWPAVTHRCYRKSHWQSLGVTTMLAAHHFLHTWDEKVDLYVVSSQFSREKFIQ